MKHLVYLLIPFVFLSCRNVFPKRDVPVLSTEKLDTIQSLPPVTATPAILETAFIKGTTHTTVNDKTFYLYGINIGKLKITSGRLIACDPLHVDEYGIPFTQVFPTGEFPVQLSIAKLDKEESIAFARISFSDEPVVRWEFALQAGQQPMAVGSKKMHGFSVDGGTALFMDETGKKVLDRKTVEDMDAAVFKEMDKHYHFDWRYALYNFGDHNLAAFSTGFGDGYFGTYIGFDAAGKPCRFVTDFNVVDWKQKK